MFVGHAALGFAAVGWAALRLGLPRERALTLGILAGAYAAIPDVDVSYALLGVLSASDADAMLLAETFWRTGNVVHRGVTHSLIVAPVVAAAAALWLSGRRTGSPGRLALAGGAAALPVAAAGLTGGPLGAVVAALFCAAAVGLSEAIVRWSPIAVSVRAAFAAALFGLASHPFGDLFTGEPPALLFPLGIEPLDGRVTLSADPTLHLLGAFGVELATLWAALAVYCALAVRPVRGTVRPRAGIGVGYAGAVPLVPPPTLAVSYHFVFSILAVGALGVLPRPRVRDAPRLRRPDAVAAVGTGLAAVTLAWLSYGLAYLLLWRPAAPP